MNVIAAEYDAEVTAVWTIPTELMLDDLDINSDEEINAWDITKPEIIILGLDETCIK